MSILEAAIGWLAPTQCAVCGAEGDSLCELCEAAELLPHGERCGICSAMSSNCRTCARCRRRGAPRHVWISTDYEGAAQKLLKVYKFTHQRAAADSLARLMSANFEYFNPTAERGKLDYLIVPVPTATSRVRARSFDHAALLAEELSKKTGLPTAQPLKRLGQARQVGAKRDQRLSQQPDSYRGAHPDKVAGRNILLVDDVITTGATLRAVYKKLRQAGAKQIDALVFAKRL